MLAYTLVSRESFCGYMLQCGDFFLAAVELPFLSPNEYSALIDDHT